MKLSKPTILLATLLLLLSAITSCRSVIDIAALSDLNQHYLDQIPQGVSIVYVNKKNVSTDSIFEEVFKVLLYRGHRISKEDKARLYITTEGKDVGEWTMLRMAILIVETQNGADIKISTEWKPRYQDSEDSLIDWGVAKWGTYKGSVAFAESLVIANEIENGIISYE